MGFNMGQVTSRLTSKREPSEVNDSDEQKAQSYLGEAELASFRESTAEEQRTTIATILTETDSANMANVLYQYLQSPFNFKTVYTGIALNDSGLLPLSKKLYFYTRLQKALELPFAHDVFATLLTENKAMAVLDFFALLKQLKPQQLNFIDYAAMRDLLHQQQDDLPENWMKIKSEDAKHNKQVTLFKNLRSQHYALVYHVKPDAQIFSYVDKVLKKVQARVILHLCAGNIAIFAVNIQARFPQHHVVCYQVNKSGLKKLSKVTVVQESSKHGWREAYDNDCWSAQLTNPERLPYYIMPKSCHDLLNVIAKNGPLLACLPLPPYVISLLQSIQLQGASSTDAEIYFSNTLKQASAIFLHWLQDFLLSEDSQDTLIKEALLHENFVHHATVYRHLQTANQGGALIEYLQCSDDDFQAYAVQVSTLPEFKFSDFPNNIKDSVCSLTGAEQEDVTSKKDSTATMLTLQYAEQLEPHLGTEDVMAYAHVLMAHWGGAHTFAAPHGGDAPLVSYVARNTFEEQDKQWQLALLPSVEISGQNGNAGVQFIGADYYLNFAVQFGDGISPYLYLLLHNYESLQKAFGQTIAAMRQAFNEIEQEHKKDSRPYNEQCRHIMSKQDDFIQGVSLLLREKNFTLGKHYDLDTLFNILYNFVDQANKATFQAYIERVSGHIQHDIFHELELVGFFAEDDCNIKIFLPLNLGDWHWVSMEIQLIKQGHHYTANVFYYDPTHGPEIVPSSHYEKIKNAISNRIAECDSQANVTVNNKKHCYPRRQINNGTCCGVYALYDIATRAQGKPLQLYDKQPRQLRQQMIDNVKALPPYPYQINDIQRLEARLQAYSQRISSKPLSSAKTSAETQTFNEPSPQVEEEDTWFVVPSTSEESAAKSPSHSSDLFAVRPVRAMHRTTPSKKAETKPKSASGQESSLNRPRVYKLQHL